MSNKRARGPLCTTGGNPAHVMSKVSVKSKDLTQTWPNAPSGNVPDIILPDTIPAEGHPNRQELQNVDTMEGFFYALFTPNILNTICECTNMEMAYVKTVSSKMTTAIAN